MTPAVSPADAATQERAQRWVVSLQSGRMTEAELSELRGWLAENRAHRKAFEEVRAAWRAAGSLESKFTQPESQGAAREARSSTPQRQRRKRLAVLALAAALVLTILAPQWWTWMSSDYSTAEGQIRVVTLPDGSVAELNTDTALSIQYLPDERIVRLLRGEAWFKVAKNPTRPFRVLANGLTAQAVGTAFAVHAARDEVTVAVTEGEVAVQPPRARGGSSEVVLSVHRGEIANWSTSVQRPSLARFEPDVELAWRQQQVVIEQTPLRDALVTLDRYRPGRILLLDESRASTPVSAVIKLADSDDALEGLAASQGLRVTYLTRFLAIVH